MGKIKTSLLFSFGAIIGLTIFISLFLIIVFLNIENKYRAISDSMILEYRITETFSQLIDSYVALLQDTQNTGYRESYNASARDMEDIFNQLDDSITFTQSKDQYLIIKNMAISIKADCDESLINLSRGDFSQGTGIYDRAVRGKDFVRENTANLILKELEYSKELQKDLLILRSASLAISFIIIIVIVSGSTFFAFTYANKLSNPLMDLSRIAENISKGDFNTNVSEYLLHEKSEIGSLSNSFNTMVQMLKKQITELNQSKIELEQRNTEISSTNAELERSNKLMIGRELKMIELKKEIEELKKQTNT